MWDVNAYVMPILAVCDMARRVVLWRGWIGDCYLSIFVAVGLEGFFCRGRRGSMVL